MIAEPSADPHRRPSRPAGGVSRARVVANSASRYRRRGFVLLAVLWAIVGAATLVLVGTLAAREALAVARNRTALTRAAWLAEGCVEAARAAIDDAMAGNDRAGGPATADQAWSVLNTEVTGSSNWAQASGCEITLTPAGARVDLNAADAAQLHALFVASGASPERADSLVDALLDWRDANSDPRPRGAERPWYAAHGLQPPRDGPIVAMAELARVRGFDSATIAAVSAFAWTEPGRLALRYAPAGALATLPGFGHEAVAQFVTERAAGTLPDMAWFAAHLSRPAAAILAARYADFGQLATPVPDAWLLTAKVRYGRPAVTATVELRLQRVGLRAAVVRRRTTS